MAWTHPSDPVAATLITASWAVTNVTANMRYLYNQRGIWLNGLNFGNTITPAALSTTTHNWAPTGMADANRVRASTSGGGRILTGISASQVDGDAKVLVNLGPSQIDLAHNGTGSTAAHRFYGLGSATYTLDQYEMAVIIYDGPLAPWLVMGA